VSFASTGIFFVCFSITLSLYKNKTNKRKAHYAHQRFHFTPNTTAEPHVRRRAMIFNHMLASTTTRLEKIHAHPFNAELSKGILPEEKFLFYLTQDALYLSDYSRALALVAARLPKNNHMQQFLQFSLDAVKAEQELHREYINPDNPTIDKTPTCFMYTNYLLKMASLASVEEAIASLLPCFFIYFEVGKKMAAHQQPNNPYSDWINLYSGDAFQSSLDAAITINNDLADTASELTQHNMIKAFVRATQLEWMFWESAYVREQWLIKD
jgi:thiaminase (transcriptional activator TenA)